ncbi:MAG: glutaryl-CoA dehydrogenase [Mycobacterium sp.]|nr:glutaryl-CoA dehydrogenase [Mycobacterium sp.]MDT5341606.1 glutaryl-CoA dehydrogenase [Mycobacterium sp.]
MTPFGCRNYRTRVGTRSPLSRWQKRSATERMQETVGDARELLGGKAILLSHNVGRFVADAEAIYSYEGTVK